MAKQSSSTLPSVGGAPMAVFTKAQMADAIEGIGHGEKKKALFKKVGAAMYKRGLRPDVLTSPDVDHQDAPVTIGSTVLSRQTVWLQFVYPVLSALPSITAADRDLWLRGYPMGRKGRKEKLTEAQCKRWTEINSSIGGYTKDLRERVTPTGEKVVTVKSKAPTQPGTNSKPEDTKAGPVTSPEAPETPEDKTTRQKAREAAMTICRILESDHGEIPEAEFYQAAQAYLNDSGIETD